MVSIISQHIKVVRVVPYGDIIAKDFNVLISRVADATKVSFTDASKSMATDLFGGRVRAFRGVISNWVES